MFFFVNRKCFTDPIYPKPRKDIQNEKRKRKHKFFGTIINTQKIPVNNPSCSNHYWASSLLINGERVCDVHSTEEVNLQL